MNTARAQGETASAVPDACPPRLARASVTVVIVNWNSWSLLKRCLDSLAPAISAGESDVLVVDNGSTDGSADRCRVEYPAVRVVASDRNLGYGAGNNLGVASTSAEFVFLLNSDAIVPPGTIAALTAAVRSDDRVALAGCRLLNEDGSIQLSCMRFPTLWLIAVQELLLYRLFPKLPRMFAEPPMRVRPGACDWVYGAAMLVRRRAFDAVGGFDPGFWMYAEEMDLCYRLTAAGWSVLFDPSSTVVHLGEGSWAHGSPVPRYLRARGLVRFLERHCPASARLGRVLVGAGAALRLLAALPRAIAYRAWDGDSSRSRDVVAHWWVVRSLFVGGGHRGR